MRAEYADLGFLGDTECTFDGGAEPRDGNLGRDELRYFERLDRCIQEFHNERMFRELGVRARDGASLKYVSLQMGVQG